MEEIEDFTDEELNFAAAASSNEAKSSINPLRNVEISKELEETNEVSDWRHKSVALNGHEREETTDPSRPLDEAKQSQQTRTSTEPAIESHFHALSAGSSDEDDDREENYQIVKKSIYKPRRKSFLHRLTGRITSPKQKYALSDITGILTGEDAEAVDASTTTSEDNEVKSLDLTKENEEDIEVSIDRSTTSREAQIAREQRHLNAEDAALGGPSEVIIHSGESDPGFVTLNPIITSGTQRGTPIYGATTKSSRISAIKASPLLLEIPTSEQVGTVQDRLLLIINALGATGLPKAEKFGTQSCLLEMKLCDKENVHDGNLSTGCSSYLMRTELHKKGGSEAQWNQQFTAALRSKETQFLHVKVKTSSKILVGEANVALDKVEDLFYDQHYFLFRGDDSNVDGSSSALLPAGQVHLQLKVVDTLAMPLSPTVVPPLHLPGLLMPTAQVQSLLSAKPIPAVLLNGGLFFKIPYHTHNMVGRASGPRRQWVAVRRASDPPHLQITWGDPTLSGSAERKSLSSLNLALVTEVREGHSTAAFAAQTESNAVKEVEKCFSLVTRARTLDLVASSKEEALLWVNNLRELIFSSEQTVDASMMSARKIEHFKQSALSPREQADDSSGKLTAVAPTKRMLAVWRNRIFNLARHDRLDDIMECLEDGCPIDLLESGSGDTLLLLACRLGNAELVDLCLSRRAKNDPHPEFGETALQVAVNSSHAHCVGLLLSTAAKSDMDSEIVNHIDPNNDAPLHVAGRHGDLACLQLLLHHGADICVVEEFGRTPLHCAVANGNLDCVAYLLDVGGDLVLNSGDRDGDTALHYAASSGNEAIVKLLLESAANVFATNIRKDTAYDVAVRGRHQRCAKLISKYFHISEKGTCASVARNDAASALLGRPKPNHQTIIFRDNGKVMEEEEHATSSFAHSEAWSPVHSSKVLEFEGNEFEIYSTNHQSSSYVAGVNAISQMPLSPSEQIRDALTRKYRTNSSSPRCHTPIYPGSSYHPVSELPNHGVTYPHNERLKATERIDREYMQPPQQFFDPHCSPRQTWDYYHHVNGVPLYNEMQGQRPSQAFQSEARPVNSGPLSPSIVAKSSTQYNDRSVNQYPPQTPGRSVDLQWETHYTKDGYPFFVNRSTGVSQWEAPCEENANFTTNGLQSETRPNSLAPDAIIRLRLAEVWKQKSQSAPSSPVISSCSTPISTDQPAVTPFSAETVSSLTQVPNQQSPESQSLHVPHAQADIEVVSNQDQQTVSSGPSKYETRTGLKLSVDVAASPAQDAFRPVLVPSPRSRSPIKKLLEGADDINSRSFEKSRASSPRGHSKNIQLIELKRANNLALALASFKIHDHYEQIVNDIVTMDERVVNPALLGCLQRFFPTEKEKQALQSFNGAVSALGKAERFFCLLFQVSGMQERIDMFLYKMEFTRTHSSLLSRILVVKRACRDLVENYSFIQSLEQFFKKQRTTSFLEFKENKSKFNLGLSEDEKLQSFRGDLEKAMNVDCMELQLQLNRLVAGIRPIQSFVSRSPTSSSAQSEERDGKARDILQRFLADARAPLSSIESEYEAMELWSDKLLFAFGESKASCETSAILQEVIELL